MQKKNTNYKITAEKIEYLVFVLTITQLDKNVIMRFSHFNHSRRKKNVYYR